MATTIWIPSSHSAEAGPIRNLEMPGTDAGISDIEGIIDGTLISLTAGAGLVPRAGGDGKLAASWITSGAPAAHASSHESGGSDTLALSLIAGTITASQHGTLASGDPHPQYALDSDLSAYQTRAEKGVALGYASLGADGLVPDAQLPAVDLPDIIGYGAAGGYIRSSGAAWVRVSGLAAADLTGNLAYGALPTGGDTWANGGALSITGGVTTLAGVIVSVGNLSLFGHTSALTTQPSVTPNNQFIGTSGASSRMALISFQTGSGAGAFSFAHSASGTIGTHATLVNNAQLGGMEWSGSDGTVFQENAYFRVYASAAHTASSMPTMMKWATTPSGSIDAAVAMLLYSDQKLYPGPTPTGTDSANLYRMSSGRLGSDGQFLANGKIFAEGGLQVDGTTLFIGDVTFTDATYDIGKTGATRPRDIFNSRDHVIGGTATIGSLTGVLRADAGVVSVSAGVGIKSLFDHYADVNNSTTVETDLYSDTLAAGRLAANGEKVTAQYGLSLVGDATSTQRIRTYFGGTLVFDTGALAIGITTSYVDLYVTVIRVSSSVVRVFVSSTSSFAALAATSGYVEVTGLTLANTQVLKITGQAAGATGGSNQITAKEGYVEWLPAAA